MYLWIFVCGILFALYNAWGIGANDCANSFATSVGSKVLTLRQAVIIAAIFEFSGAVLMGSHVTKTVRKSIVDIDIFNENPGMFLSSNFMQRWIGVNYIKDSEIHSHYGESNLIHQYDSIVYIDSTTALLSSCVIGH